MQKMYPPVEAGPEQMDEDVLTMQQPEIEAMS
jgi:hypothetical protein